MSKDKELEIQMQFLEEARDYLNTLETVLLEIDTNNRIDLERINAALRAAHSIKGGAGMMGFRTLSDLAHRLEDSFKVLKTRKNSPNIDTHLQSLLLSGVDWLRQIVESLSQGHEIEDQWLSSFCYPVFDELRDRLGEPTAEDAFTMLSPEDGQDIVPMLFETEVEGCLQRLESILADSAHPSLQEEVVIMAAELGGLGEMLQLPAFTSLCQSIEHDIGTASSDRILGIAQLALQSWRRSQALILTNQRDSLPTKLDLDTLNYIPNQPQSTLAPTAEFIEDAAATDDLKSANISELITVGYPGNTTTDDNFIDHTEEKNSVDQERENSEHNVRVPSKQLEQINDLFGELTVQRNGLNSQLEKLRKLVRNLNERVQRLDQDNHELRTAYGKITKTASGISLESNNIENFPEVDNLEIDSHDKLNLRSQEVMESIIQVQEVATDIQLSVDDTDQITRKLNKTSKQLQTKLTHIRMRPLSDLIKRFPRALRDLNVEYGKNVHLQVEGGNTLIERSILEALNEPIMHLLRNAFDHGIEDSATRRQLGKPEQGLIEITATHRSNRTIITMRDDGRGISLEKIRSRAVTMGLDTALVANANEEELLSIIFEPGFTTSDQVTALSGRGVGMDIVRNNLKSVRGDITVDTELGVGTTFTLSVPFTLSVARVLLVESNKMLLAFPAEVISEIFLLSKEQVFSTADSEVINWQNTTIPLIRLGRYFKFNCPRYDNPELETRPAIDASSVLIVKGNNQTVAIQVDRCWGEQELAIRQVEGNIPLPAGFSNCIILGDGRVLALVNTNDLLYWIATNQPTPKNNQVPSVRLKTPFLDFKNHKISATPANHKGTILIIDDSINVRRFLALTLEKGGYEVEQAKDGQDALEKLESGLNVAAIICDIEMPRLDGYGFLERINSSIDMKHIPVTMLTSRSSNKHRQLAMQLGAQAYFSKPYNEQELLQTVTELIRYVPETATSN
ncbi:hybrid sensor histidine kinase/response regulator [Nodularia sphaerocarpa]|uniref:hybrid sensor histidine kinase/response regulator n=1 Tax=Nodularia sphaerocarpa TaxID=137816 RepID=UPI001EFA8CD5|nr:hybrid sensor histidine kinase/response regulator [Nodularia sphaerocarpa]MDB9373289.1 hybrid sensor histidine kinase/response regulator [Nodularia sphaerocarpa CS-585]MDB9380336.1 hybrid sensor histidine kinase/response regulator [Nodularia sphaerocarpa CS-585A2]ULP70702.1 Gliding motility regulatory protein [Nodularia sphaerocarpa UHCC 0038]